MVSKWEAGGEAIRPRPLNQAALDTSLGMATSEVKNRFAHIVAGHDLRAARPRPTTPPAPSPLPPPALHDAWHLVRHPLDGKLMTMIEAGPFRSGGGRKPTWLEAYYIDVYPTTNVDYTRFLAATGHPAPVHWPDGRYTIADDPNALHDDPVTELGWEDVLAYAHWASKELPTTMEWDRAARGTEGMATGELWEWCRAEMGPGRRGPKTGLTGGFRCVTPAAEMLSLLAI
jgi:hypothetical protein